LAASALLAPEPFGIRPVGHILLYLQFQIVSLPVFTLTLNGC